MLRISIVELENNQTKHHIKLKFGTELQIYVKNDKTKSPIFLTLGNLVLAQILKGQMDPFDQTFYVDNMISIIYG